MTARRACPTLNAARAAALTPETKAALANLDCELTILAHACRYFADAEEWREYKAASSRFTDLQGRQRDLKRSALLREQPTGYIVYRDPGGSLCSNGGSYYLGYSGDADFYGSRDEANAALAAAKRQMAPKDGNHAGYNWGVIAFPKDRP